jgi:putative hydrolase
MEDDLFSKLFELFNQPGPINWKLAAEAAHHLAGDPSPVDPWAAEELRELVRLAEVKLAEVAPFPVSTAPEVLVLDPRGWVDRSLEGFGYLAEAIAAGFGGEAPAGLGASLAGMQVGALVGGLSRQIVASFESGLPVAGEGPVLVIGTAISDVVRDTSQDPRNIHLWAAANEVAHRAIFRIPWTIEHLRDLAQAYSSTIRPDPEKLSSLLSGGGLEDAQRDPAQLEELLGGEAAAPHRHAWESFLGVAAGYRRSLVQRALSPLLPTIDDFDRSAGGEQGSGFGLGPVPGDAIATGVEFCAQVEERFGLQALEGIWIGPERLPTPSELTDVVGWAARVLLDEFGPE